MQLEGQILGPGKHRAPPPRQLQITLVGGHGVCVHMNAGAPEASEPPGVEVIGDYEPPYVGTRLKSPDFCVLNCSTISPAHAGAFLGCSVNRRRGTHCHTARNRIKAEQCLLVLCSSHHTSSSGGWERTLESKQCALGTGKLWNLQGPCPEQGPWGQQ